MIEFRVGAYYTHSATDVVWKVTSVKNGVHGIKHNGAVPLSLNTDGIDWHEVGNWHEARKDWLGRPMPQSDSGERKDVQIAKIWSIRLGVEITPRQVAIMRHDVETVMTWGDPKCR